MTGSGSQHTLEEIAAFLDLPCDQNSSITLTGIASLQDARQDQLSFLFDPGYAKFLPVTKAGAVILASRYKTDCPVPVLVTPNPRMAFAKVTSLFDRARIVAPGIDPTARISASASLGKAVYIGPNAVIGDRVVIKDRVVIDAGVFVDQNCKIGEGTRIWPNVTLYHDVQLGDRCVIHAGAVIGADGFGFDFDAAAGCFIKIHQVYGVIIGKDVEIGAATTIDRGALNHTTLGDGVKLDNQIQVGHGSRIGNHTVISGCTAIAGSVKIGQYCLIGGGVGIVNNLDIVDHVEITAMTLVSQSIKEPGRYSSGTGLSASYKWKRNIVAFNKLNELSKRVRQLERLSTDIGDISRNPKRE